MIWRRPTPPDADTAATIELPCELVTREPDQGEYDRRPTVRYIAPCDTCPEPAAPWRSAVTLVGSTLGATTNAGLAYCDHDCTDTPTWTDALAGLLDDIAA